MQITRMRTGRAALPRFSESEGGFKGLVLLVNLAFRMWLNLVRTIVSD